MIDAPQSRENLWLVRLIVLLRAVNGPVSEDSIVAELERRKIGGVTLARARRVMRDLFDGGYLRETNGRERLYAATRLGRKEASVARGRLTTWFTGGQL
jgi:hypothetical protein